MGFSYPQSHLSTTHSSTALASTTPSSTTLRGSSIRATSGLIALIVLTTLTGGGGVTAAYASTAITLAEDTAVVLTTTGTLYRLNLSTGELTEGPALSIPAGPSAAIEAAIDADSALSRILVLELSRESSLTQVRSLATVPASGTTAAIKSDYGVSVSFGAITRGNEGSYLVGYTELGSPKVATFAPTTGLLSGVQTVTLSSKSRTLSALVTVSTTVLAFDTVDATAIYTLNATTGVLASSGSLGASILAGEGIVAADASSDGTVYLLTRTTDGKPVLYRVTSATTATPTVTRVGVLTVSGGGATPDIQALAIATLLDSERPEPEPEPEPEPDPDPEPRGGGPAPDPESEVDGPEPEDLPVHNSGHNSTPRSSVALTTPPASPVLAPTGAAPMVATWLGVFLFLTGVASLLGQRRRIPR